MSILGSIGGMVSSAAKALGPIAPIIGAGISYLGGMQQNVASAQAAQKQMDFQSDMSNTSYQRQIADLKAAGINPMLVSRLGGASTPAGAMPQFVNPGMQAGQVFSQLQSSSAQAAEAEARIPIHEQMAKKIEEEIKNIPLEGERIKQAAYMLYQQAELMIAQKFNQGEITEQIKATVKKLNAETGLLNNQAVAEAALDNLGREVRQLQPIIDLLKPFIGRRF